MRALNSSGPASVSICWVRWPLIHDFPPFTPSHFTLRYNSKRSGNFVVGYRNSHSTAHYPQSDSGFQSQMAWTIFRHTNKYTHAAHFILCCSPKDRGRASNPLKSTFLKKGHFVPRAVVWSTWSSSPASTSLALVPATPFSAETVKRCYKARELIQNHRLLFYHFLLFRAK